MPTNVAKQKKTRQRRRKVERLYLDGYGAKEIHDKITGPHKATYPTIREDITIIRKAWVADLDAADEFEGRHRYLAATRELRRKAEGVKKYDLVHTLDKEIARLSGVNLKVDDRTWKITLDAAMSRIDEIMGAVFSVVEDRDLQDRIIEALEVFADE